MNNEIFKHDRTINIIAIAILAVGALAVFFFPWIFSQHSSGIDFSKTGEIGDTIGGITAPVIGLVSAALIYLSFLAQRQANKLQWDTIRNELYLSNLDKVSENLIYQSDHIQKQDLKELEHRMEMSCYYKDKDEDRFGTDKRTMLDISIYIDNYLLLLNRINQKNVEELVQNSYFLILQREFIKYSEMFNKIREYINAFKEEELLHEGIHEENLNILWSFSQRLNDFMDNSTTIRATILSQK
jgi:hypothetical protein